MKVAILWAAMLVLGFALATLLFIALGETGPGIWSGNTIGCAFLMTANGLYWGIMIGIHVSPSVRQALPWSRGDFRF